MTAKSGTAESCPHCGEPIEAHAAPDSSEEPGRDLPLRYDLEELAKLALSEKAYDETVKVRVTQEEIRKLVEKHRKKAK
jgi:hypothetical protein